MAKNNHQEQIDTAIQLARTAADTATALASAKVQSDIVAAGVAKDIEYIKISLVKIDATLKEITDRDEKFVLKEDFTTSTDKTNNRANWLTGIAFTAIGILGTVEFLFRYIKQ
jgi:Tfp pilus assembly protein FimT